MITETVIDPDTHVSHVVTRTVESMYPLPANYWNTNVNIYLMLLCGMVVAFYLSRLADQILHSRKREILVPLTSTNTGHLPARESLVRASIEPAQSSLVRSSEEPAYLQQQLLLRVATETPQQQEWQLLRVVGKQE